jgi:hypothetical protein
MLSRLPRNSLDFCGLAREWLRLCQRADPGIVVGIALFGIVSCGGHAADSGGASSSAGAPSAGAGATDPSAGAPGSASGGNASQCVDADGGVHAQGDTFRCSCNTCTCQAGGTISSTAQACLPCLYEGAWRYSNKDFSDRDGCNTCSCYLGTVSCSAEPTCSCDPPHEWWRSYVSTNPAECTALDYACEGELKPFSNACGCGCEEPTSCPEYAQCDAGVEPEDCQRMLAVCPYVKPLSK